MSVHSEAESTTLGRKTPTAEMPMRAVAFRWLVGLSAVVTLVALLFLRPPLSMAYLGVFLVASVLADAFFRTRVAPGAYYSFSPTFTLLYFLVAGGVAAALLEGLARVLGWIVALFRRQTAQTPLYGLFNAGVYIFAALAGGLVVQSALERPVLFAPLGEFNTYAGLALFGIVYLLTALLLGSAGVAARAGWAELTGPVWLRVVAWTAVSVASCVGFAIILWELAREMALTLALLFVFLLMAGIATMLRLNVGLRSGNEELRTINRIGQLLAASLDATQIFRILARETRSVLPWDGFFIATAQPDGETVQIIFMTAGGTEIAQRTIPRRAGLTGRAMDSGEALLYERKEGEKGTADVEDTIRGRRRPRSILVAPMMFGSEALGAISVQSFQFDVYNDQQRQLLGTVASQAAIALRNAELLRREQRAIGERDEFLSLTTHEIKNPLTSVRGYLDLAEGAIGEGKQDEALESLGVVRTEAARIQRFAEDLLEVSRIGGGKFTVHLQETDVSDVVRRVVERYAATSRHRIELRMGEGIPPVMADPVRLGQAVENLVSNAVKYSPEGSRIDVSVDVERDRLLIRVRDEGQGIPESKIPLIFERFYRLEEGGETVKGTGLGLFITREIVRMHGGTIRCESAVGRGTTFIVDIPIHATDHVLDSSTAGS
ncbi:MAG: ATP-binding protein [Thermoanaerobaculia bacterium]